MIVPRGGVAFTEAVDGDMRNDRSARVAVSGRLGIAVDWATMEQVHGNRVVFVDQPGVVGEADAMFTNRPGLPIAVMTADCMGVIVYGEHGVGVAHAGWRGMAAGVVAELVTAMTRDDLGPRAAYCGSSIQSCCFEVGGEVSDRFPGSTASTTWGADSVDLLHAVEMQLGDLEVHHVGSCTRHEPGSFSYRRDGTRARMATIAWWGSGET